MSERGHDTEAVAIRVDNALVKTFASLSGDVNLRHTDADYARRTTARGRTAAQGALTALRAMTLSPTPLNRPSRFHAPALPGETYEQPVVDLLLHCEDDFGPDVAITSSEDELGPAPTSGLHAVCTASVIHIGQALTFVFRSQGSQRTGMWDLSAPAQNNPAMTLGNVWNCILGGPGGARPPGVLGRTRPVSSQETRLEPAIGWGRSPRGAGANSWT
jgi:hypothetical protein